MMETQRFVCSCDVLASRLLYPHLWFSRFLVGRLGTASRSRFRQGISSESGNGRDAVGVMGATNPVFILFRITRLSFKNGDLHVPVTPTEFRLSVSEHLNLHDGKMFMPGCAKGHLLEL